MRFPHASQRRFFFIVYRSNFFPWNFEDHFPKWLLSPSSNLTYNKVYRRERAEVSPLSSRQTDRQVVVVDGCTVQFLYSTCERYKTFFVNDDGERKKILECLPMASFFPGWPKLLQAWTTLKWPIPKAGCVPYNQKYIRLKINCLGQRSSLFLPVICDEGKKVFIT